MGYFGINNGGECYASVGKGYFIQQLGNKCESLWINEDCTVYAQNYTLGVTLPQRAVIAGFWPTDLKLVVASIGDTPGNPGYYVEGATQAVGPFVKSAEFTILVVL